MTKILIWSGHYTDNAHKLRSLINAFNIKHTTKNGDASHQLNLLSKEVLKYDEEQIKLIGLLDQIEKPLKDYTAARKKSMLYFFSAKFPKFMGLRQTKVKLIENYMKDIQELRSSGHALSHQEVETLIGQLQEKHAKLAKKSKKSGQLGKEIEALLSLNKAGKEEATQDKKNKEDTLPSRTTQKVR